MKAYLYLSLQIWIVALKYKYGRSLYISLTLLSFIFSLLTCIPLSDLLQLVLCFLLQVAIKIIDKTQLNPSSLQKVITFLILGSMLQLLRVESFLFSLDYYLFSFSNILTVFILCFFILWYNFKVDKCCSVIFSSFIRAKIVNFFEEVFF